MTEKTIEFDLPVEADHVRRFAAAVGDEANPLYSDPRAAAELGFPGPVAPPTFPVTQIFQVPREERESRLGANLDYGRVLHGEQEFVIKRLPLVGETLKGVSRISKDFKKEGKRGGTMRFVTYETRYTDADGEEVLIAYYTLLETAKDVG
ncbi:MAG TPA: MaoC family dehydratase N-terminal domain-containing protein [Actinomycetota bacterium]|nr:MaoC family dehydratase N-terminal domain-containing protein [Actinomycetota bacterium]